jgi:hypothetical protein
MGACLARRPAAALRALYRRRKPWRNLKGAALGKFLAANLFLRSTKRCVFDAFAKPLRFPVPAFARDSIDCSRSMSYLLSSVDPVLYCDQRTNSSRTDCFIACFIDWFRVCFFACFIVDLRFLVLLRRVHRCQCAAHIQHLRCCCFIHYVFMSLHPSSVL